MISNYEVAFSGQCSLIHYAQSHIRSCCEGITAPPDSSIVSVTPGFCGLAFLIFKIAAFIIPVHLIHHCLQLVPIIRVRCRLRCPRISLYAASGWTGLQALGGTKDVEDICHLLEPHVLRFYVASDAACKTEIGNSGRANHLLLIGKFLLSLTTHIVPTASNRFGVMVLKSGAKMKETRMHLSTNASNLFVNASNPLHLL